MLKVLNSLIEENRERSYKTAWDADELLGNNLERCRYIGKDPDATPLDAYPFRELWEEFYQKEIRTPELLMEIALYQECRANRGSYEQNLSLYERVFGKEPVKKAPFSDLVQGLRYGVQARTVLDTLFEEYVPDALKARFGLYGTAALLSVLDSSNDFYMVSEKRWNGEPVTYTRRAADLPICRSSGACASGFPEWRKRTGQMRLPCVSACSSITWNRKNGSSSRPIRASMTGICFWRIMSSAVSGASGTRISSIETNIRSTIFSTPEPEKCYTSIERCYRLERHPERVYNGLESRQKANRGRSRPRVPASAKATACPFTGVRRCRPGHP